MTSKSHVDELQMIPGVGPSIAADLRAIGIQRVADLRSQDPELLYARMCDLEGPQDRCLLYVFRCAVYFASTPRPNPKKLLWWNWKDEPR
ncbi:MAG: helix-hairpin-helix domain-containing protein [Actinomycetota bacterium]